MAEEKSLAVSGIGSVFQRWDETSGTWEVLAEVTNIDGPNMTREFIEVTSLSTTSGYRKYIPGLRDGGTVNLTMNFRRDNYDLIKADFEDKEAKNYEIVLPDEDLTSFEFTGLVTELPLAVTTGDKITNNVTIKIDGKVEVNDGSGSGA